MEQTKGRTRRAFLVDSVAAAAALGGLTMSEEVEAEASASRPARVIACRDAHLPETGEKDAWSAMSAIGVEGVEVTVNPDGGCPGLFGVDKPFSIASADGVKRLAGALKASRKKISAFCLHNHFDERPDEELALVKMTTRASVELGTSAVRLDVVPRRLKGDAFLRFAIDMGKRIMDATEDSGVRFGVENHGGTTNRPDFLAPLFEGIGSKRFGLTLDTANFYWFGHPLSKLYDIYTRFAGFVCHTHCKSIGYPESEREKQRPTGWEYGKYCCPIDRGDIDFKRVIAILRKSRYTGDFCIENESLGRFPKQERKQILKKEADFLRKLLETA